MHCYNSHKTHIWSSENTIYVVFFKIQNLYLGKKSVWEVFRASAHETSITNTRVTESASSLGARQEQRLLRNYVRNLFLGLATK